MADASTINSSIFTSVDFLSSTKQLVIDSDDISLAGFYDFLVTVYYDIQPDIEV